MSYPPSKFQHDDERRHGSSDQFRESITSNLPYDDDDDDSAYAHTRLLDIIDEGMPRLNENRQLTAIEANQRKELVEHTWERIRKWLWDNQDAEIRANAATTRGNNDATPLHNVCKLPNPPADIVQALLEASLEPATWADSHGWLPLHHACANGASGKVLEVLTDAFPDAKKMQDSHKRTPLHFYLTQRTDNSSSMATNMELLSDSGAAELADIGGMLPMHYACAYGVNPAVLNVLREAYPESLIAKENKGRTPMHLAMVNAHRDASPGVIKFLLEFNGAELVNVRDHEGYLPLHLLALGLKGFKAEEPEQRTYVCECLKMYLAAEPKPTADFFTALQDLPDWLQDVAVVTSHVKNILNERIVQRFPTFLMFCDLVCYLLLITFFELVSEVEIKARYEEENSGANHFYLIILFLGATYFLLRELVQIVSLWSMGSLSSWFHDPYNWLDVLLIVLIYFFSVVITTAQPENYVNATPYLMSNETFKSLSACTKVVLWLAVISFLRTTLIDFAIFVGGVLFVFRRLGAFALALAVFLLMFAQVFYFIYNKSPICRCDEAFPHCEFGNSLVKVFTMMMGEIGGESRYFDDEVAQVVYVAYTVLIVILLSNVLIAIVTESYEVIQNDRAASVFWGNRLDFVAEVDAIIYSVQRRLRIFGGKRDGGVIGAPTSVQEGPYSDNLKGDTETSDQKTKYFYNGWRTIVQLFDQNVYDDISFSPRHIEFWCYLLFQAAVLFIIIPIWLIAGALTFGILWPPQIREFILAAKETTISRADMEQQKLQQLKEIQASLKILKVDIKKEMATDREDMLRMKNEVESTQNDVMSDLQQVRELMTTLLDMGRQRAG